jgi:hypothetical protein
MDRGDTFKIDVYTFGKIYTMEEKVEKIEVFNNIRMIWYSKIRMISFSF